MPKGDAEGYTGTQALWPQMIAALAAIDDALGLPDDGCNSTAQTLDAIRELRADNAEQCRLLGMGSEREARLMAQLAESQARELRLREALGVFRLNVCRDRLVPSYLEGAYHMAGEALAIPKDDSALREMIAQALDEVADEEPINGNELAQVRVRMKAAAIRARKG